MEMYPLLQIPSQSTQCLQLFHISNPSPSNIFTSPVGCSISFVSVSTGKKSDDVREIIDFSKEVAKAIKQLDSYILAYRNIIKRDNNMGKASNNFSFLNLLFSIIFIAKRLDLFIRKAEAGAIGVNYGMLGNNLPPPNDVVALLKSKNITKARLFNPNIEALQALQNSSIEVILGTLNQDLQPLSTSTSFAWNWVQTNVLPLAKTVQFRCISAGNEVIPSDMQNYVLPAMQNLKTALDQALAAGLLFRRIPVTTAVATSMLGVSYPPSMGQFSDEAASVMGPIAIFLATTQSPLLLNVYPYFAYVSNPVNISLPYALFTSSTVVVRDGAHEYRNLFDAMVDATYSALERSGGGGESVEIVASESGWPSGGNAGDVYATIANAETYNNNLISHVTGDTGTPKRPGKSIETYVFAMFNENLKPGGTEQNFGLFYPNQMEVYPVNFI
ncbi:putative glucan endo-1,3-beta-glucosidase GVI [Humulus lupulus]|uniref:putative glucan endo-1,3-beta-glucosidase GVI n=1 Tax=Humulus lupulus TaxID=3486 RepID=UPI002B408230|nr:putative glucan endo-1,3-beta-glucosidase GVI [Humulus lupulus]